MKAAVCGEWSLTNFGVGSHWEGRLLSVRR